MRLKHLEQVTANFKSLTHSPNKQESPSTLLQRPVLFSLAPPGKKKKKSLDKTSIFPEVILGNEGSS